MPIRMDLSAVPDSNLIPDCTVDAYIFKGKTGEPSNGAKTKGAPTFSLMLKICEDQEHAGRTVWDNFIVSETTLWRVKQMLAATGEYEPEQLKLNDFELDPEGLGGRGLRVRVKIGTKAASGGFEARNEIKRYSSAYELAVASGF